MPLEACESVEKAEFEEIADAEVDESMEVAWKDWSNSCLEKRFRCEYGAAPYPHSSFSISAESFATESLAASNCLRIYSSWSARLILFLKQLLSKIYSME